MTEMALIGPISKPTPTASDQTTVVFAFSYLRNAVLFARVDRYSRVAGNF